MIFILTWKLNTTQKNNWKTKKKIINIKKNNYYIILVKFDSKYFLISLK